MCNIFRTRSPKNFKLGKQMDYEDLYHWQVPWSPTWKVKVARSRHPPDRCWPISRERNVLEIPKLLGRLPTPPAITCTRFKVKGQRSRLPRRLMLRSEVDYIFRTERPTNFKLGTWSTKTCITNKHHDLKGQRSRSRCHMVRLTGVGP